MQTKDKNIKILNEIENKTVEKISLVEGSVFQTSYGKILKISIEEMYNQGLEFYSFEIRDINNSLINFLEEQQEFNSFYTKYGLDRFLKEYSASLGFEKMPYIEFSYFAIDRSESNVKIKGVKGIVAVRPVLSGIGEEILMGLKNISFTHYDSETSVCERFNLALNFKYIKQLRAVKKELNSIFHNYKDFKYHYLNIFEPKKGVSYMSRSVLNELVTFLYRRNNDDMVYNDLGPDEDPEIPVNIQFFEATYLYVSNNDLSKPKYYFYKNYHDKDWFYDKDRKEGFKKLMIYPIVLGFRRREKGIYNIIEIFEI